MPRSRIKHFKGFSIVDGDIKVKLDMSRFEKQFRDAQKQLDGDVMNSMVPFMPHLNGSFIQNTRRVSAAIQGSGKVYAAFGEQGRYLYEGKVMVNSKTKKGPSKIEISPGEFVLRFPKGSKLVATQRKLTYTKTHSPDVTDHWFDAAKAKDGKTWIANVKETAGGGKHG